jgi:glycine hydroxymethyltransferase
MKEDQMIDIAHFIKRVVIEKEDPTIVAKDVSNFRKEFQKVHYTFDNLIGAYEYISLVNRSRQ